MNAWMGIVEFLQEVDHLARMQSACLDPPAPSGDGRAPDTAPCAELSEFTTQLLQAARSDAFEASDSPDVQVLEAELNATHTRWQFGSARTEAA
jgi:hypothetical protein